MNPEQEVAYLESAAPELKDYLLSHELYWPLNANQPRLTIGGVLLSIRTLQASDHPALRATWPKIESVRLRWRTAWQNKARAEFESRIRLWGNFLSDYISARDVNADLYRTEVRQRVLLQLLMMEMEHAPALATLIELDSTLRSHLIRGAFIWDSSLAGIFPETDFWFLYGTLRS